MKRRPAAAQKAPPVSASVALSALLQAPDSEILSSGIDVHEVIAKLYRLQAPPHSVAPAVFGQGGGEIVMACLSFLNCMCLAIVRGLNTQWRRWAEADKLWQPEAVSRWPMLKLVSTVQTSRSHSIWYKRFLNLEQSRAARLHNPNSNRYTGLPRNYGWQRNLNALPSDLTAGDVCLLLDIRAGGRKIVHSSFKLQICKIGELPEFKLCCRVPRRMQSMPLSNEELSDLCVSAAVKRHSDGKLLIICTELRETDDPSHGPNGHLCLGELGTPSLIPHLEMLSKSFDFVKDKNGPPALVHSIVLERVRWGDGDGSNNPLESFEFFSISLIHCISNEIECTPPRHLLRAWQQFGKWV